MIARFLRICGALALQAVLLLPAHAREPLRLPSAPELYQRVLTRPGAQLAPTPGGAATGTPLPAFSVLYVYDRKSAGGGDWLEVGARANGRADGWITAKTAEDWRTMLVMQYAPASRKRERVLMFDDKQSLLKLLNADDEAKRAQGYLDSVASGHPDPAIIAVEPIEAVDTKQQLYVMPILDSSLTAFPDTNPTRVLQIASVPKQPIPQPPPPPQPDPRVGIVFVLDTTLSMGPYIERARQSITNFYHQLEADGVADRVRFGLVAYRNNMDRDPRIEYVTRIYQRLDPAAPPDEILRHIQEPQECPVPTPGWDEDAFAGLYTALTDLNWEPFALKLLVLITDSGGLPGKSPLAHYHDIDIDNIIELANAKHVAAVAIHLLTPAGNTHGIRAIALRQWHALGSRTGDPATSKYIGIGAGSLSEYQQALSAVFGRTLVDGVREFAHNTQQKRHDEPDGNQDQGNQIVVNELFRAQAEYFGRQQQTRAPDFFRAWTTDHDLLQTTVPSLNVRVFLTRSQLNTLAQNLDSVIQEVKRASVAPETFFDNLQLLSATMSGNPDRAPGGGKFDQLGNSNLLPAWLGLLPYRSKVLRMSKSSWLGLSITGQQEFIDELEYKLKQYRDMYANNERWTMLDPRDPTDAVYPVPLDSLP